MSASPFMGWLYDIFSVHTCSALLGVFELAAAALLAVKPRWPRVSVIASLLGVSVWTLTDALRALRGG